MILAMHQPVYAADVTHGSNLTLADGLETCFAQAGRAPDAVFTGHAHNYQRFVRRDGDRAIPYVVAGAGGYPELHALADGLPALPASFPGVPGVTLEAYEDTAHGFMTVTATPAGADVVYTAVTAGSVVGRRLLLDRRGGCLSATPGASVAWRPGASIARPRRDSSAGRAHD